MRNFIAFALLALGGVIAIPSQKEKAKTIEPATNKNLNTWIHLLSYGANLQLKGSTLVEYNNKLLLFGGCRIDLSCSNTLYVLDILYD